VAKVSKMKFLISALLLVAVAQSEAFMGADVSKWTPMVCDKGSWGPHPDRMKEIGACSGTYGTEPGKKNPNCVFYCHAVALGVLGSNGLPSPAIYDRWVDETFPAVHKSGSKKWFRDCYEKHGKAIGKGDQDCTNAKKFLDCTWGIVAGLPLSCAKA